MKDLHILAGRGPYKAVTQFVNRRIVDQLAIRSGDRLVDVGCGDGFLLRLALKAGVEVAVGLNASEAECRPLRVLGLDVRQGLADSLPLPDRFASVVVCSCVLLLVPEKQMSRCLFEIARVCQPNARVWIGEIPRVQEPPNSPTHQTIAQMLWWMLRKRGLRSFLGMCRRLLTGAQRGPVLINPLAAVFWASPEVFSEMASKAGLALERSFPHQTLDENQNPCVHPTRHDYLFRRV
jgi:ubiquinone/menaquinone biosynthesis C-methylase UbiE